MTWSILIEFHKDRTKPGKLRLIKDKFELVLEAVCMGLADKTTASVFGNPSCDPLHKNGNTPCGTYSGVLEPVAQTPSSAHSLGLWFIRLTPLSGDALTALQNGRADLGIHGGTPNLNPNAYGCGLRCTYGCVRCANESMAVIAATVQGVGSVEVKES